MILRWFNFLCEKVNKALERENKEIEMMKKILLRGIRKTNIKSTDLFKLIYLMYYKIKTFLFYYLCLIIKL